MYVKVISLFCSSIANHRVKNACEVAWSIPKVCRCDSAIVIEIWSSVDAVTNNCTVSAWRCACARTYERKLTRISCTCEDDKASRVGAAAAPVSGVAVGSPFWCGKKSHVLFVRALTRLRNVLEDSFWRDLRSALMRSQACSKVRVPSARL